VQTFIRLTTALGLAALFSGCASTGSVPQPFPAPGGWPDPPAEDSAPAARPPSTSAAVDVNALVVTALDLQGVPYRNGGTDLDGFDCSGFTQYVFGRHGITLDRETGAQFRMGQRVEPSDVKAGDLLFFSTVGSGPSHVAIAVDRDEFVHAPSSRGLVRVERLSAAYWSERFIGARRVTD